MQLDEMRANRQILYVSHQTRSDLVHIQILFIYQLSRIAKKKMPKLCACISYVRCTNIDSHQQEYVIGT